MTDIVLKTPKFRRRLMKRLISTVLLVAIVFAFTPTAQALEPSKTHTVETGQPFEPFVEKLRTSVKRNKLGVVAEACAHCGAQKIGVTIPGNRVIMVFAPPYAVRMLEASVPAGIEAPIRIYLTEQSDGTANLSYVKPTDVFAPYGSAELNKMAKELDAVFEKIIADSLAK
jgi:uncharacterized protein (DUF302 family)